MKVGYHYTTYHNWLNIKQNGLVPRTIHRPEIAPLLEHYPVKGIWIWQNNLSPVSELGSVLYQLTQKTRTKIVKLEVQYYGDQRLYGYDKKSRQRGPISLTHTGTIGEYQFHPDKPEAYILTEHIPPEHIRLVRVYELLDLVLDKGGKKS